MSFTSISALDVIPATLVRGPDIYNIVFAEHARVSHVTGNIVKSQVYSNIREQCQKCLDATCSSVNFKILATGKSGLELLVKERLFVDKLKPLLNVPI